MTTVGARVGAILSADDKEVQLLGYGVYVGDEVPPQGPFGATWEEFDKIASESGRPGYRPTNPKIVLDDGSVVWGQECWWGDEERVRKSIGDRRVKIVTIER
jgi:hypothetical protein